MRKIEGNLPERLVERGLTIVKGDPRDIPPGYLDQLILKSRQPHVLEFEGHEDVGDEIHPGRFRSREDYYEWVGGKRRVLYLAINKAMPTATGEADVAMITWFSERMHPDAPGYMMTFAIRAYAEDQRNGYGQYVGQGLAIPFMTATHEDIANEHPAENVWLDLVEGNEAATRTYGRFGYEVLARNQGRIVMGFTLPNVDQQAA